MRLIQILVGLAVALPTLAETVAFRNANVIAMTSPRVAQRQTVIVRDGKIEAVSKDAKIPEGATIIDATGKFLIPGLAEMHGHIPPPNAPRGMINEVLFLYAANGITTVRGMLGHEGQLELREKALRGELVSPTLYLAGPSFNGQSISSPDEAVARVRAQKKEGWDLLKVHPGLERDEYEAMAKTAREEGMRFAGHVPESVGLIRAIEMGHETFDHMDGYVKYLDGAKGPIDPKKLAAIVKRSKDAGVWIVPTSALWEVLLGTASIDELLKYQELQYVPKNAVATWVKLFNERVKQNSPEVVKNIVQNRTRILRALHEGGVKILMGTDAPQQFSVPGFSLHRELKYLREAGMSPYEILRSGTVNVGEYFKNDEPFGTIEPGRRADLVLLEANPLDDIDNLSKIRGVMLRGKWLSRDEIDKGLAEIAAKAR